MMVKKLNIILVLCFAIFTFSCANDDDQPPLTIGISQEIKDFIYFKGDEDASVDLINAQSGADTVLSTFEVDFIFENCNTPDLLAVYVYGETDQALGGLTEPEVQFLESKNVSIIVGSGNHDETLSDFIVQALDEALE